MIVSIRSAVFPVWRSPMMSWRWPRPIGVIESMALMPVWRGSVTGWRSTTEGAWTSSKRRSVDWIGPFAVDRVAEGVDDPTQHAVPTGTERTVPVCLTGEPSSIWEASPMSTTPRSFSSMLRATPRRPPSNSSNSEAIALGRPCTRATPSAIEVTYPTVSCSTFGDQSARRFLIESVMSAVVIVNSAIAGAPQGFCEIQTSQVMTNRQLVRHFSCLTKGGQAPGHAAVDDDVTDPGDDATDDARIDDRLQLEVLAGGLDRAGQSRSSTSGSSGTAERISATALAREPAARAMKASMMAGRSVARPDFDDKGNECPTVRVEARPPIRSSMMPCLRSIGSWGLVSVIAKLVRSGEGPGDGEELALEPLELTFGLGDLEDGRAISVQAGSDSGEPDVPLTFQPTLGSSTYLLSNSAM